jgi:coenzyme F420-reducing hydrogenase delta subunit
MCTGRVDLAFIVRAFERGADGVIIGGCWPGECHYVTEGNYDALGNMLLSQKLLARIGLRPERVRLEWISASEGTRFAEVMNDFVGQIKSLGPLGQGEGEVAAGLGLRFGALGRLVPFLKLVERERLRIPTKSEKAYHDFYASDELDRLLDDVLADRLAISQILLLLQERPLSTGEISETLGLNPSDVSRHMISSSRQGLVRYDVEHQRYARA